MLQKDSLQGIKGEIEVTIFRHDGKIESRPPVKNLVVSAGLDYLAALQSTSPGSVMNHMHVGSGTTAASLNQTALASACGSRVTMATRTAAANVLTEVATFAGFITGITSIPITEIGIFNHAVTGGTMRSRAVFSSIVLANSDFLQFTYRTTIGSY